MQNGSIVSCKINIPVASYRVLAKSYFDKSSVSWFLCCRNIAAPLYTGGYLLRRWTKNVSFSKSTYLLQTFVFAGFGSHFQVYSSVDFPLLFLRALRLSVPPVNENL